MASVSFKIEKDSELSRAEGHFIVVFTLTASASGQVERVGRFRFERLAKILGELNVIDGQALAEQEHDIDATVPFAPISTTITEAEIDHIWSFGFSGPVG